MYYSPKSIDDFKLIIMKPSPKLTDQENHSAMTSFGSSSQDQYIETNTKIIMTHVLKSWNENKYILHPSTCELSPAKTVALNIYSIELK